METKQESIFTSRKLASVQVIEGVGFHSNGDKLELAQVLGWQVVIKKDEFIVGEKVVYFEIDSLLPEKDWSAFMKERKYRVRTIKLRGELSQGLCLPLKILGEDINEADYEVGQNLTEILGVQKYEYDADLPSIKSKKWKEINNGDRVEKVCTFPTDYIEKTDEPRIQSEPKLLEKFIGKPYFATLKYDGTSVTYVLSPKDPEDFWICSRNFRREYDPQQCVYSEIADKYKIKEKLLENKCKYVIQGEIYGPKLQNNPFNVKENFFAVFNIKDIENDKYLDMLELIDTCKLLDLPMVDIIDKGDSFSYKIDELKKFSQGNVPGTSNPREGLVFRLQTDWHPKNDRISFKIINDEFLLKKHK